MLRIINLERFSVSKKNNFDVVSNETIRFTIDLPIATPDRQPVNAKTTDGQPISIESGEAVAFKELASDETAIAQFDGKSVIVEQQYLAEFPIAKNGCKPNEVKQVINPEPSPSPTPIASPTPAPQRDRTEGKLIANDANTQINVRVAPDRNSTSMHYGLPSDRIYVLSETTGTDGFVWHEVEFVKSGAKGWVRGDFVSVGTSSPASSQSLSTRTEPAVEQEPETVPEEEPTEKMPVFANCKQARAAGYSNFPTTPGSQFDRDSDGIGCES
jgi:hypothetical protein